MRNEVWKINTAKNLFENKTRFIFKIIYSMNNKKEAV